MNKASLGISGLLLSSLLFLSACQPIALVSAVNAGAVTAAEAEQCTLATLKGRYLFAASGTLLPPAFGVTEPVPAADAGFHIFNGDGTGTDYVTVRINGEVALDNFVTPFTYTVNPDCTGESVVPDGPTFDLFLDPKGDAIAVISTGPQGNYVSRVEYRVSSK